MDDFKKELQKLKVEDLKAIELTPSNQEDKLDAVRVFACGCGGCFRCGGCGGCFRCGGCGGCGGCFRCFGCGGCFPW